MNDFLSSFLNKISNKVTRRKTTKWNKNQIKLDLLKLEERLVPAPNLVVPTTTSGAPLGFVAGTNLAFSGALDIELLDTPTPTSNGNFSTTVAATAGTASATASGAASVTGSGTNALTIAGNLADVNATLNSLTYTNSTTGTASLVVTASDSAGTPLTDTKTIYVNAASATAAPTITTALANVAYYAETTATTENAISFTVSDPQGASGIVVTGTSSNTNLILNTDITIAGTYPNFTVALKHQANVTGTALITLKVSDGTNFTTKSFNVSVSPTAQYYWDIVAGNGTAGITDGTGTAATFNAPWQIAVDTVNNLYVADFNSGTIRKITPAGVVTTIAGSASSGNLDNANPLLATFKKPRGVGVDNNGNVYVSEGGGGYIRKIAYNSANGTYGPVTTLASSLGSSTTSWGMLVVTPDGSTVYAANTSDKKIYKIDTANNTGAALTAAFGAVPMGLSFDNNGNLLVREMTTGFTYQVTPAGVKTTLITAVQYGNAQAIQLADGSYLSALSTTISRISPPTRAVVVGGGGSAGALGLGAAAGFADIGSISDGPNGFIYVSDFGTTQNKIRVGKPAPSLLNPGTQSTLEGTRLAFSSANLTQLGALANASDSSNVKLALTYTLSVQNGTLDFNNVAAPTNGMTVTFSADSRSVTLVGAESAINTYMLNFGYTPDAGYINAKADGTALASGAASPNLLSLTVTTANNLTNPITGSLNLVVKTTNNTPRIVTALPDKVYIVDSVITTESAINLTIADADTAATAFINNATTGARIVATSDNPNLILASDIALSIGGTGNARTFTVKHQANITGVANITITINDGALQSTYTFKVTVKSGIGYYWGTLTTVAGNSQITTDSNGDFIAANYITGAIWRITPQGATTLLKSGFTDPLGVAIDANKNLYVTQNTTSNIMKVPYNSGTNTYGTPVVLASVTYAGQILLSPDGTTLYVASSTQIKQVNIATGAVSVLAGSGAIGTADGTGLNATFTNNRNLSYDNNGNILTKEVNLPPRQVTLAGVVTTFAAFSSAEFLTNDVVTIVQTRDGNYVGFQTTGYTIRVATPEGSLASVSGGTGTTPQDGLNRAGWLSTTRGSVSTPDGKVYMADRGNSNQGVSIRVGSLYPSLLNPGMQSTPEATRLAFSSANLAQLGAFANDTDMGLVVKLPITYKLSAQFGTLDFNNVAAPNGVTVTFSADRRSVTLAGAEAAINTYMLNFGYTPDAGYINANSTGGALASGAVTPDVLSFSVVTASNTNNPVTGSLNLVVKSSNNTPRILTALPDKVYLVDSVITTENAINFTIADADTAAGSFVNNATTGARIVATSDNPNLILASDVALAIGGTTNARTFTVKHQANITGVANITITIADAQGNQSTYTFKVTVKTGPSYYWGTLTNTAGSSQITYDSNGDLIALDYVNGAVRRITPQGASTLLKSGFTTPYGVAIDANKNLYVSDGDNSIKKVPYNSLTNTYGTTTILAPGVVTGEILISPDGTTLYGGKFYQIVKINIATGAVSVLAGSGVSGSADGVGLNASFSYARYLAWDNNGNILAAEANSNVRLVTLAGVVTTLPLFANAPSLSPHQNSIVQTRDGNYVGMVSAPVVRVSTPDGSSTVVSGGSGSSNGLNRAATFTSQRGGVATPDGKVYITDNGVVRVGTLYPSLLNPGTQSTLDGVRLAFSSANLAQLGATANDTDQNNVRLPITYTLSAQFGTLDFNNVAVPNGVTVTFSADRKSVTLSGLEAAINTYMLNLGYTPDANYINANMSGGALASGAIAPDVLSFSVVTANNINDPVTGSLNILVKAADPKPKIITALPDRQYYVENATATETAITFKIADSDTATFTNNGTSPNARITVTSDNPNLILPADMATAIGGTGANRTFTVKHQANITGVANVTITINDGTNLNTYTFKVTVVPTPSYYWNILAGSSAGTAGTTNATGTSASFSGPTGLVKDSQGNYFVTDTTNNLIRKITPQGAVTTFAGFGGTGAFLDGAGTAAKFNSPQGLAIDSSNNLYVADFGNNRIRKIDTAGNVTTIAGTGVASSLDGAALSATLRGPTGIAVDSTGTVYWADTTTSVIRKLQGGQVTTIAGSSGLTGTTDGTGNIARFNLPTFLTINNAGNLVVNDATNLSYRQVTPAGVVTTLFNYTSGATAVGVDAQGNIYAGLSSNTLSLMSSFDTTTIMGTGTVGSAIAVNTAATVGSTRQMVFLSDGTIVIADFTRNNIRVGAPIPSLMNPGKQIVLADQLLTFDNVALEGLGIQSNGYPEPLSITLTVTKGVFSLSQTTGLTFATGDGTNDTTMTFTGSMANINSALTGLVYNFDEVTYPTIIADTLTISTPYTVGGVTSTISQVVPIQIVKPPVITAVADKLVNLGSAISAATFTVTDADTAANALTYTITSSNTALVANSGLVRTGGTGSTSTTGAANAANSLAITAVTGRTGTAIITISVFDGAITTATTFSVTVSPIVGAPDLMAASDTGTSTTDNLTSDTTPTFAISIGGSSGIQVGDVVAIYNGTTKIGEAVVTAADILAGSIQVTTSALADGNYSNITSSVVFGATRGAISAPLSPALVIDATAPSANSLPDLTSASDTGASSTDNVTNNTTPSFTIPITGSGAIAGDKVELYSGTTLIGTVTLTASDITNGSATVVVSPALAAGTYSDIKYRLADTAGNTSSFSGSMSPALVIDLSAPTLVTLNPADNATNLVPPTTLVMTLSEAISKGTGSIVIKKTSDNSIVETFNVATSGRVMVSNSTVTITPSVTLAYGTGYYVTVANTALLDLAGNAYAGLANTTDWNFTTLSSPPAPTGVDLVSASDSGSSPTDDKTNKTDITLEVALANGSQVGDVIKLYDGTTVVGTITLTANDITAGKVSFNLVNQADGTHSYDATLSNNAGESAHTSVLTTVIDTSLPGAPTITPIVSPSSNTTPTLTGTAEAGATVTVVIDGTSVPVIADGSGNWSYTIPTALAPGSHTVVVTQTDSAGNIGVASSSASFVVDTTAPIATTFSPADDTTVSKPSVLSITFNEAIALGSTGTITIYDDTNSNNPPQVISLPDPNITVSGNTLTILPTTALIGGTNYHVEISSGAIKDLAGNAYAGISNATDWNFTTNNAPSSPSGVDLHSSSDSGTSNSDNKTNATALNFDVPIPAGAVVGDVIKLYDGTTEVGSITLDSTMLTAGTVTFNLTGVTSGSHSYTSTLTSAGLESSPSPALVVDVNNTLPSAPVITPLATTKNQTPTISGTAPANSTVTLNIGSGAPVTVTTDANGNWNYTPTTPLTQGTYVLSATATDLYGNISLVSAPTNLVIDTTAPTKPIITGIGPDNGFSSTDKITNANVLTIAGTAEANSLVTVYDNGTKIGTTTTDANGVWTFTTAALTDGSNRFSANATDSAGNKSVNADSYTMVVDASAPTAPVINSLPSPNGDNTPTISGTGEPGAVVTINANGSPIGTAVVDANGNWSFTPTTPISDGTTAFTATQNDTAGNNSPTSNTVTAVIDTTAPSAPAINSLGTINSATPAITGTAEPGSTIKLYNGTTLVGTAIADSNGNWTITPSPALNEGTNNLIATATDPSGNISPTSSPVVAVVDTVAPIATSFSPATGSASSSIFDNLVINFSEAVALGSSGIIELRDSNGVLIESFSVSSNRLTLSGNSLTIDPTANLTLGTGYYVTMTAGTIKDLAGNAFAGVTNNSDWAFTTSSLAIPPAPSGVNLQAGSDTGSSNTDNITSDNTPTFDIALNPSGLNVGDVVHLYDNGVEVGSVILTAADIAAGKVSITSSALADGVHSLTSKIEDAIGTFSAASPALSVSIVTQPPAQAGTPDLAAGSDTGSSSTDNITSIKTPTFNGTGTPGETVSLFVDGVLAGVGVVDSNGNYSITASTPIADGVHAITTQNTNIAGISGAVSAPLSLTVDSTPPATPTTPADMTSATDTGRANSDNITSDTTPDFSGSGLTPGNTVVIYVDGQPAGTAVVDANGNWTATVSPALSDGSHTVTYLVNDLAGNASEFAPTMNITVDTALPAKPSVPTLDPASDTGLSATDGITRDTTPTINGTGGTPGFDVILKDGNGNTIGIAIVAADGTWSITPTTPLVDGAYNFTASYTSISGVAGPASDPISVVIDTVAPSAPAAPTISTLNPSATAGHTNSTTPVFEGSGLTPGNLVELFDGNTKVGSAIVDANGNYQIISSTLADGAHSFTVKVTDAAGNTSGASSPTSLTIDSRVPGSPTTPDLAIASDTGTSNTDNITNNNTPVFQGVVDATSSAIAGDFVEIYSGNILVGVGVVVSNNGVLEWSVTVGTTASGYTGTTLGATTLSEGTQAISAKFRTPAGSASASSQALTVVVDTTVPAAPSGAPDLAASSDTGTSSTDDLTNDTTPTFTGTGGVPGDTVNLYANGTLVGTATVGPDGSYSVSASPALTDGTYAFTTKYADPAGNLSSASSPINVTIDSTPPAVPSTPDLIATDDTGASNFDNLTSVNQPTFEGFGTTGDTIEIYVDGVLAGTTIVDANGNWSITTNSIADGVHQITSVAIDPAGNASAQSTPLVLTIDSSAPNSPIFTTTSGPTTNAQPPISGTGEPGSTITLYDGTTPIGTAIVNANGSWSITPSSPLAEGTHTFTTTATDGAGNISLPSSPIAVTIDTSNPLPPVIASVSQDTGNPSDKITSDNTLTITGNAEPGTTITVYDSSSGSPVAVGTVVVGADGTYSVTTSPLTDGSHPLSITSTDSAGNESQPAAVGTYIIDTGIPTAPTFGSVSQDTGNPSDKITSDNTLTVTGLAGSAEPGTTITIYDSSSGSPVAVGTAVVAQDGSYSVTTSALSDGNHPLSITSTDSAGNESLPTSLGIWSIDTAAPAAPSFGSVSQDTGISATDKITSDNTLTISGAAGSAEPGTTITVYDTSSGSPVAVGTAVVALDGSYSVTTSVLSDGNHPLSITATDAAGNESSPTSLGIWTIDTAAPTSPVVTSVSDDTGRSNSDKITSDNTLTVTGNAEPNSLVTIYAYIDNSDPNIPDTIRVVVGTGYADANGNYAVTTNPLADNALNEKYVLSVTATDPAGMESPETSIGAWGISTSIPNPPVVTSVSQDTGSSSTDKLTNDTTLTVTGTGTPGTTITIYDGITPVGTGLVDANGNYSVTTSPLADGAHALSASATNPFGFEGLSTQLGTWNVDTLDPIQPTLTANNGLPLVSGLANSAEPGSTVSVVIGGATYTAIVDGTGAWSINLATAIPTSGSAPALATGTFPISVFSTDAAGNSTTPVVSNLVVTTIGQPAPSITSNPSTSDTTPLISGNSEIGSTVTVTILDANNNVIATYSNVPTNSNGTWALDLQTAIPDGGTTPIPALVDGNSYNLSATATDANNQFTSVPATQKLVIDTTAPNTPVITSPAITNDTTPLFTGTAEPGTVIELTIKRANGTSVTIYQTVTSPIDPNNPNAPGTWSIDFSQISPSAGFLNDLADGNYIVEVVAIDAAFNRSTAATQNPFIVDTVAPATPVITSPSLTNDNTPVLTGTAEPGSTVTVVIAGLTYITTAASPSGAWSVDLGTAIPVGGSAPITGLTDGINTVTVTATDLAGNTSAPATQNLRVDTTPPAVPQITSSDKNKDTTPVITGLAEPGSTVEVTINGATFSTIAGPNGSWSVDLGTAIPNGGTTPIAPLVDGNSYPISVIATDAAGNTSAPATQTLAIDTSAPISPTITSPALTNQVPPTVTGTAEPGSTVTLTINGATYTTTVDANGNWTLNTATATPTSGTLGAFTDGPYPISVYSTDASNNQSGTSTQTLTVDLTPPVIVGALASFGVNLNLDESNENAIVSVNISGIEDGQIVTVTLNGLTYTGTVFNGKVDITIPVAIISNLADGSSQTLTVTTTDLAGNAATPYQIPFTVDKTGPARPSFVSITSTSTDPNPADQFTGVVNPTVVISGQAGQTIVIHGPNGIVDPSNYTVVDNNGLYTITFTTNQTSGSYQVNLQDANGNENANGPGAQNFFTIDSIPVLYDMPNKRSTAQGSTFGNLGVKNTLNGQSFNVPQQADNTWIDLDGETLTFGLSGSTVVETDSSNNPTMIEASINGASLKIDPRTGAYTYTPVSNTDRLDTFFVTIRDTSGNQTQLKLMFNSRDTLDRDGIGSVSESVLAGLVNQSGNATNLLGDLNQDGTPDSQQNSVSTLAWRKEADFQIATDSNTAANTDPTAIICIVVNATAFDPATTTTLTQLMGNVDPLAQILQVSVSGLSSVAADASKYYKPWDIMNFSVESLVSTGLNDVNATRDGTQIQVSIDISKANIPMGGYGFSLYRKFVSANIISDYADAGITLTDLDGNIITTAGWFDYTQRTPGGDGAIGKDFNNDGKIDAIIITLTDNAFGDDNPIRNTVDDPITPTSNFPPNPGGANPAVPTPPGSNPISPAPNSFAATGTSTGSVPGTTVNIYPTSTTTPSMVLVPFENWQGEVRIVRADINADGNLETIATMGEGGLPILRVFDGVTGAQTMEIQVYDQAFNGGIFVAIGDLGNDGILDIVTGAGNGGGPHVKIFNSITGVETSSFMAYDINFRGGISVAVGDVDGSGFAAIVTGAGPGGGPHVKVFNGTDHSLIKQFMAYTSNFLGGVYVSVGDYLSDGKYEIITGAGAGGGPHIKIWDYETLNLDGQTMAFTDFTKDNGEVIDAIFNGGVRVALADANGDNVLDILAGAGPSGGPRVQVFVGFRLELLMDFFTGDKNDGRGVFVSQ